MREARFDVVGPLDRCGRWIKGKVIINREQGLVTVRPHRKRKIYTLPLLTVAAWVCRPVNVLCEDGTLRGSRFFVEGKLLRGEAALGGTVIVSRTQGLFMVRPFRKRRVYARSMTDTATWICRAVTIAELKARRSR